MPFKQKVGFSKRKRIQLAEQEKVSNLLLPPVHVLPQIKGDNLI